MSNLLLPNIIKQLKYYVLFSESFDATWPLVNRPNSSWSSDQPAGTPRAWHRNNVTASGWMNGAIGSPSTQGYTGGGTDFYARFHTYGIQPAGTSAYLSTGDIDLSTSTNCTLNFYYINPSGTDVLNVYFSNDGGSTWSSSYGTFTTSSSWTLETISIPSAYQVSNFRIKFNATSDYGDDDIGLDQVEVSGSKY